jgi:hypothetical protein
MLRRSDTVPAFKVDDDNGCHRKRGGGIYQEALSRITLGKRRYREMGAKPETSL